MKNLNVLVTGGVGLIGSHLVRRLVERCNNVIVLDNLQFGNLENIADCNKRSNFHLIIGDIRNRGAVREAMNDVDAVVHLAGLIDIEPSVERPFETHDVNVSGTLVLLEEAMRYNVKRFLFASSAAVYGKENPLPLREDQQLKPISPYAASKAAAEQYVMAFHKTYGLPTSILRFFNVYSPSSCSRSDSYTAVITTFLNNILNNQSLVVYGDGEQTRDFVHIEDVVNAIIASLNKSMLEGAVLNICTGEPITINELARTLIEISGRDIKVTYGEPKKGDIHDSYGDPSRAKEAIGFRARISIREGLRQIFREMSFEEL